MSYVLRLTKSFDSAEEFAKALLRGTEEGFEVDGIGTDGQLPKKSHPNQRTGTGESWKLADKAVEKWGCSRLEGRSLVAQLKAEGITDPKDWPAKKPKLRTK